MATANDTVSLFNGFILDRTRGCLVHSGEPATRERNRFALEFKKNPLYDSLRSDRRFQQLADQVKIKSD